MYIKQAITGVLLLFIGVCVVAMIVKEDGGAEDVHAGISDGVAAIYFHRTKRCTDCEKIESYSHEAITTHFKRELDAGELHWRVANCEDEANRPYVKQYNLEVPTVVLVRISGGKPTGKSKTLTRAWELLQTSDKAGFVDYVRQETEAFLDAEEEKGG